MDQTKPSMQHENFDISEQYVEERAPIIRQKRVKAESQHTYVEIEGKRFPIVNYSTCGIAVEGDDLLANVELLEDVPLYVCGIKLKTLQLKKARTGASAKNTEIGYEIMGEPLNFQQVDAAQQSGQLIQSHQQYMHNSLDIPMSIKAEVYEIKDWLEHLKMEIDAKEKNFSPTSYKAIAGYEKTMVAVVADYLHEVFPKVYGKFENTLKELPDEIREKSLEFLHQKLSGLLHSAPFAKRAYSKPLGYAGDYEMMNLIYRNENVGESLFARCLHRFCIDVPAAQAVRNRASYLVNKITSAIDTVPESDELRILSVACGPSKEWQLLVPQLKNTPKNITVDLLDQDEDALLCAQSELKHLTQVHDSSVRFRFVRKAIKNVISRGMGENKYDLIYSAGLFDYFSDPVAFTAASKLFDSLKPGGKLIIGNFDVGNPSKTVMDYVFDWPLIYRSEQDLRNLYQNLSDVISVEKEELNINLFCVIEKKVVPH